MRRRTDPAIIIGYALYLYFNSRSFRLAAKSLSPIKKRSHVAIWTWVQKYADCADRLFRTDRRLVRAIFVDETLIRIDGHDYWLWVAYEPVIGTCLMIMVHLSHERTLFVCYQFFFKQLQRRYGRKPPYSQTVLDGITTLLQMVEATTSSSVWHRTEEHMMERFIQQIKDRTECFDDHFSCRKEGCDRQQHVWNWLKLFLLYLHTGMNRRRFMMFFAMDGG